MITPELQNWAAQGHFLSFPLFNHKIFYQDYGSPESSPEQTLLLLHGFPESSYSFRKVIVGLQTHFTRIVVFDMIGYGLSDKPVKDYTYSLFEQADLALWVWQQLGVKGGHLLAHDMGDSVTTELLTRYVHGLLPSSFSAGFQSVTFTNGSMVLGFAKLRLTQKLLLTRIGPLLGKLFNFRMFQQQVRSAHGNNGLSDEDVAMLWQNVLLQDGQHKTYLTIRYLQDRMRFEKSRWLPALTLAQHQLPLHICWGDADAVANIRIARYLKEKICPKATFTVMPDVGHFCQISNPDIWLKSVLAFYKS
ncbi:MAG: alpha/beta fold hydrolase [Chitinophagales bacterium]